MNNTASPIDLYIRLTTSLDHFGKLENELTSEEREKLTSLLETQVRLHTAILSSPEAARTGVSQNQVSKAMSELKSRFNHASEFDQALEQHGLTPTHLKQVLKQTLHRENVLETIAIDVPAITAEEAERYYFQNIQKFEQPERRKASHILITINDDFAENTVQAARERISDLRTKATPSNFGQLALRHSECPTAMNNGHLGLIEKGQLHSPLDKVLFNMASNSLSEVVETEVGFHLLWCESIVRAHRVPFGEAKAKIREQHHARAITREKKLWVKNLLATA